MDGSGQHPLLHASSHGLEYFALSHEVELAIVGSEYLDLHCQGARTVDEIVHALYGAILKAPVHGSGIDKRPSLGFSRAPDQGVFTETLGAQSAKAA